MSKEPPIPICSIKPGYMTVYFESQSSGYPNPFAEASIQQPVSNKPGRNLSDKAKKRLKACVGWLYQLSKTKEVYNNKLNSRFKFKVNFITLTLPVSQRHNDNTLKSKCLNQFLTEMRTHHKVHNYVWRAEAQKNGNLHFHIMTDTFIDWKVIRLTWNRILDKLGYIDRYQEKFKDMSFEDYRKNREKTRKVSLTDLIKSYEYGKKSNWRDPNSTDVHRLKNKKSIEAYISKYMTKNESKTGVEEYPDLRGRKIPGRKWGVSQKLGSIKSATQHIGNNLASILEHVKEKMKVHIIQDDFFTVYCARMEDWKKIFPEFFAQVVDDVTKRADYVFGGLSPKVRFLKYI